MTDVLGRSWQLGTIQLDAQMPARFGLTYMGPDNHEHPVFVIHRAFFGSFERFLGILTEHYAGAFPFWLAPVQVRLIPVGENHREAVGRLRGRTRRTGSASTSTSATTRSGSGSGTPSSRRSRSRSSTATASRTSRSRFASAAASS